MSTSHSRPKSRSFASSRAQPSVTIYVKTTPLTQDIGASRIALKNLALRRSNS